MSGLNDLPLFSAPPPPRELSSSELRQAAFDRFHRENPAVYAELVRRARFAVTKGCKKMGMRRLWEVLRWDVDMRTVTLPTEPKFNDHHAPFYARLIMAREGDLAGFFETRGSEAGEGDA